MNGKKVCFWTSKTKNEAREELIEDLHMLAGSDAPAEGFRSSNGLQFRVKPGSFHVLTHGEVSIIIEDPEDIILD